MPAHPKKAKPTYAQRNLLLPQLGFSTYNAYLASALWAEIRDAVLDRDDHQCRLCGDKTNVVHHLDYSRETLLGDTLDGLAAICRECHGKIEKCRACDPDSQVVIHEHPEAFEIWGVS